MRVARLLLALLVIPAVGALSASTGRADGCSPCVVQSNVVPGSNLLAVRDQDRADLRVYDLASGRLRFRLPPGVLSANGRVLVSGRVRGGRTTFVRYDVPSGRAVARWSVRGRFHLATVSASGRRLALVDVRRQPRGTTSLGLLADRSSRVLRIVLRGRYGFGIEAVADDGRKLFLLAYRRYGYVVQALDVATGRLVNLRPKGEPTLMRGFAGTALPTPDGRRLLTLFLGEDEAAVHALDLTRAQAVCIDLPANRTTIRSAPERLQQYGFVLTGRTLVAANPALGVVARLDLAHSRVLRVARFGAVPDGRSQTVGAASHDGRTVYFASGRAVWAYDAAYGVVRGAYWPGGTVVGLGFSPDDRKVRLVLDGGRVETLAAPTGRALRN